MNTFHRIAESVEMVRVFLQDIEEKGIRDEQSFLLGIFYYRFVLQQAVIRTNPSKAFPPSYTGTDL